MKKIIVFLLLIAQSINFFAIDVKTQNLTTRINDGKVKYIWRPQMAKKPTIYNALIGDPGYIAELGLDCYSIGDIKQYAVFVKFQYIYLEFPGVLPMGSCLTLKTKDNQDITLNSILAQSETKYVLLPIGHDETSTWGYFPISEDEIKKLSVGVDQICFDYEYYNGERVVTGKSNLKGGNFSKKITSYYKKISKKETKLKNRNSSTDNSVKDFLSFDPAAAVLLYHGYRLPVFLYQKYLEYSGNNPNSEAYKEYQEEKEIVQSIYNSELLSSVAEKVQGQTATFNSQMNAAVSNMNNQFQQLSANLQQERAQKAAEKRARQEQANAKLMAMEEASRRDQQEREAAEQRSREKLYSQSGSLVDQMNREKARTQNRQAETSDGAQYMAQRMSDATYGTATTNRALAQQRQYDAQQNQQARINSQREADQQLGITERAVTSSGAHIQIKVKNGIVTAYGTSQNNYSGTGPEWKTVKATVSRTTNNRYGYEANIGGSIGKVFWGEPTTIISDKVGGIAVNAVTLKGEMIQIRVEKEMVVAHRKSGSLPWNTKVIPAKKTNVTYDGEQIASKFKYKAELPEIGTVYF